ncbi:hypothetical protein BGX38DRAFT_1274380 [Terfezia claveryi]|nr:hypothetical protein BGX38DRAFT_1274380 [Terfezia claveryi]
MATTEPSNISLTIPSRLPEDPKIWTKDHHVATFLTANKEAKKTYINTIKNEEVDGNVLSLRDCGGDDENSAPSPKTEGVQRVCGPCLCI